jgi:hypothetical protein
MPTLLHRFSHTFHTTLEPILALLGAYNLAFQPAVYFAYMPAGTHYSAASHVIYDQLAACYVFLAFIEAVVLRVAWGNQRVWTAVLAGLVVCDMGHVWALHDTSWSRGMHGKEILGVVMTFFPLLLRLVILVNTYLYPL